MYPHTNRRTCIFLTLCSYAHAEQYRYTKNAIFSRYNHPSLPAGCLVPAAALVAPGHCRIFFEAFGGESGRRCPPPAGGVGPAEGDEEDAHRAPVEGLALGVSGNPEDHPSGPARLEALRSPAAYRQAVAAAKGTAWTRKGLVDHETDLGAAPEMEQEENEPARNETVEGGSSGEKSASARIEGVSPMFSAQSKPTEILGPFDGANPMETSDGRIGEEACEAIPPPPELDFEQARALVCGASIVAGLHPDQACLMHMFSLLHLELN